MIDENKLRNNVLEAVKEYYNEIYSVEAEFSKGDRISYAGRIFDDKEMCNLTETALDFWLTSGRFCEMFERKLSEYLNIKYVSLVNSGSSANLLAFSALTSPLLGERQIKRGDEVISVACCFPTTVSPIIQYGAVPVFIDVTIPEYNINVESLEVALNDKTKAIFIAHTLGNPFNLSAVKEFCNKHNLWLIEDNCDALGSKYTIDGCEKYTGTIGDIGTSSFYPPHHMTMGEGGAVYTDNPLLHKIINSFRDWGRDCSCPSGKDNICNNRYTRQFGELPLGYDHKYVYSHFGYNLKATEMQASIGLAQIDKLDFFTARRIENHKYIFSKLSILEKYFILPRAENYSVPSWFGFVLTCKDNVNRNNLVEYLEKHNIQTRMLFAGNIIKHPCFDSIREDKNVYRVVGDLSQSDKIVNDTFWIGVYPGMNQDKLDYMCDTIISYCDNLK